MRIVQKYKDGNSVAKQDNTRVSRPEILSPIKAKQPQPKQYQFESDNRSRFQKIQSQQTRENTKMGKSLNANQHLWNMNPTRQVTPQNAVTEFKNNKDAIKATVAVGSGTMAATAPIATAGSMLGNLAVNKIVKNNSDSDSWGDLMQKKTGVGNKEAWEITNPGGILGGAYGASKQALVSNKNLISKFFKGDEDLGWSPLNKEHWIFDSASPTNVGLATANRVAPFLSTTEKIPGKIAAYLVGKRTKGNASVTFQDLVNNGNTYTGSSAEGVGKNLLGFYLFRDTPILNKTGWFKNISNKFQPIDANERARGFSFGKRYDDLYPGVDNERYYMTSVVPHNAPFKLSTDQASRYIGNNINKVVGKEAGFVVPMGGNKYMANRRKGENWIHPIDDVAGHLTKIQFDKGNLKQTSQDLWKFNPKDYKARWGTQPSSRERVRLTKQAALMDKAGKPFILQQSNPIRIDNKRVFAQAMSLGGRFTFKKNSLTKGAERINGKRDMRKKFIKSTSKHPDYKRQIKKGQQGLKFVDYETTDLPTLKQMDFSNGFKNDYSFPTINEVLFKTEPIKEEPVIKEETIVEEPVKKQEVKQEIINSSKGLDEFNRWYDEVEANNPEAKEYRRFLTLMAQKESGFNSTIQNRAGAPAYGYFQFMQDDKKYNNIKQYAGTDVETFRNNPKLQIEAAIKLAKSFEKGFSKEDLDFAAKRGFSKFGLLGGAWLAGNGGVRKYLRGLGNPSDKHWSSTGAGTDVASRIKEFNF